MKSLIRAFTDHPASMGEPYIQHMGSAFSFGRTMAVSAIACFMHGLFPFLCVRTASEAIVRLHRRMVTHRSRIADLATASENEEK